MVEIQGLAATVVLLRDSPDGPEVLLLERPERGSFPGAWVFPGGAVDEHELVSDETGALDEESSTRLAAIRETSEETGLTLDPTALVATARWVPPLHTPKRMLTWFYLAAAPEGDLRVNSHEAVASEWTRPAEALRRHASGSLTLFPPTWVTLHGLADDASVEAALERSRAADLAQFGTRLIPDRTMVLWEGDVAYDDLELLASEGPRHRLEIATRPWVYRRTI